MGLAWFRHRERPACRAYRASLREGIPQGRRLDLVGGGRIRSAVRAHLAVHLVTQCGLSLADAARQLGVSTSGIAKAVARAEAQ